MMSINNAITGRGTVGRYIAIGLLIAIIAGGLLYFTRSRADPVAFCAGSNKLATLYSNFQISPTKPLGNEIGILLTHMKVIAPASIRSEMKTEADDWNHAFKTGDKTQVTSPAYTQADQALTAWVLANCK